MAERMYSLFKKDDNGKWKQTTTAQYPKATAVRVFQDRLLSFDGSMLRPVPTPKAKPTVLLPSQVLCKACDNGGHGDCGKGNCACACRHFNG